MQLIEALMESDNITATIGKVTLLVQRCSSEQFVPGSQYRYLHTTHHATEGMYHGFIDGDEEELFLDIYERDDDIWLGLIDDRQLEDANWQPTTEQIDLSTCRCRYCYSFRKDYGLIGEDVSYDQWRQS